MIKIRHKITLFAVAFFLAMSLIASSSAHVDSHQNTSPWHFQQAHQNDLWQSLRKDFCFSYEDDNPYIKKHIKWFQRHPKYFQKILKKSEPFLSYVYEQTRSRSLPAELVLIPMIESEYDPSSVAHSGPAGMWQIMPGTAHTYGLKMNRWYDGRRDVTASTKAALDYLAYLHNFLNKDWLMAVAAYQTGEIKAKSLQKHNLNFWQSPLARAHSIYLPKLLAIAAIIKDPERYHIALPLLNSKHVAKEVNLGKPMNLLEAAKEVGISLDTLHRYNPGLRQDTLIPNGPYTLLVPAEAANDALLNQELLSKNQDQDQQNKTEWTNDDDSSHKKSEKINPSKKNHKNKVYKIRKGDTLNKIAKRFNVSLKQLKQKNHLKDVKHLKLGQQLIIQ